MSDKEVVHSEDLAWSEEAAGAFFASRRRALSESAGGEAICCEMLEVGAGKTAAPFQYRLSGERAIYVLAGTGTLRRTHGSSRVRAGDYIALVAGPKGAAQLTNTGSDPLRYLLISTGRRPDVVVYPDSDKIGVQGDPFGRADEYYATSAAVDRWKGEPVGDTDGEDDAEAVPGSNPGDKVRAQQAQQREDEREAQIDAEIEQMKRRLGERARTESKSRSEPQSSVGGDDDIDALKAKLDAD